MIFLVKDIDMSYETEQFLTDVEGLKDTIEELGVAPELTELGSRLAGF